jgi:hypothetical protein
MKIKGHSGDYGLQLRVQRGDARRPRYVSDARCEQNALPAGKKRIERSE